MDIERKRPDTDANESQHRDEKEIGDPYLDPLFVVCSECFDVALCPAQSFGVV
jgi:hypothetical protein